MSKQTIHLTLVEMYAVKHGLQMQLRHKENELKDMQARTIWEENMDRYEKLQKDIPHEEALIIRFESEIRNFKEKYKIK